MKKAILITLLPLIVVTSAAALSDWAETHGVASPYAPPFFLSGFGMADESDFGSGEEARMAARQSALGALAERVQMRVRSDLTSLESDSGINSRSSLSSVVRTSSDIHLQNVQYETEDRRGVWYVLAYARVADIAAQYIDAAERSGERISNEITRLKTLTESGDIDEARRVVASIRGELDELQAAHAVLRALSRVSPASVVSTERYAPSVYESQLAAAEQSLQRFEPRYGLSELRPPGTLNCNDIDLFLLYPLDHVIKLGNLDGKYSVGRFTFSVPDKRVPKIT